MVIGLRKYRSIDILFFLETFTVEGVVAALKTGRNCVAVGSTALKLYAQRQVMARLTDGGDEEEGEREFEEDTN